MAPLHGALKVVISLRLKDDLIAEIDRVAAAHGQTRSAWIAQILTRTVLASEHDDLPIAGAAGRLTEARRRLLHGSNTLSIVTPRRVKFAELIWARPTSTV
jgi:predicted transcriptional regulator